MADLFDGRLKHVKTGARNNRQNAYLNLKRKQKQGLTVTEEASVLAELVEGMKLPKEWLLEIDHKVRVTLSRYPNYNNLSIQTIRLYPIIVIIDLIDNNAVSQRLFSTS